jgi:hypothetical protein
MAQAPANNNWRRYVSKNQKIPKDARGWREVKRQIKRQAKRGKPRPKK